ALGQEWRQPNRKAPRPGDAGADEDCLLCRAQSQRRSRAFRLGDNKLEPAVRASPDLGGLESERALQRLHELQEEILERDGAGEARPEGSNELRGRPAVA